MKKCAVCLYLLFVLSGCDAPQDALETGMELRSRLLQASQCSFEATVTADFGSGIYTFTLDCQTDSDGNQTFTVLKPETIAGISGQLSGAGGMLTFGDTALCFKLLADGQLSPVSAPWILIKTLRSGYLTSACRENDQIRLSLDDSYEEDPLRLDIWLTENMEPESADILYDCKRILSLSIENFEIL